jgi:hypothetical protein
VDDLILTLDGNLLVGPARAADGEGRALGPGPRQPRKGSVKPQSKVPTRPSANRTRPLISRSTP